MLSIQLISGHIKSTDISNVKILEMPLHGGIGDQLFTSAGYAIPCVPLQTGADVAGQGVCAVGVTVAVVAWLILSGLFCALVHWSS